MTKRIVSGIFILTALGALGVILAGALTSGEQLIVRFLTAVIVAALGLYVISDLRLQADDDAAGIRPGGRPRLAGIDAPPNSTAAFMATVTGKGESPVLAEPGEHYQDDLAEDGSFEPHEQGVGATSSSTSEHDESAVVEDAESPDGPPMPSILGPAPVTVRASDLPPLTGQKPATITELFGKRGTESDDHTWPTSGEVAEVVASPAEDVLAEASATTVATDSDEASAEPWTDAPAPDAADVGTSQDGDQEAAFEYSGDLEAPDFAWPAAPEAGHSNGSDADSADEVGETDTSEESAVGATVTATEPATDPLAGETPVDVELAAAVDEAMATDEPVDVEIEIEVEPLLADAELVDDPVDAAEADDQTGTANDTDEVPVTMNGNHHPLPSPFLDNGGLGAIEYADAPLAPIIDLRDVNTTDAGVDAAIKSGELEVISALIEQGMLSTDGPISDRDVRTMVYVAFTSNELRKLLLAGGTPEAPNPDIDLGPVELFDSSMTQPPKTLYTGQPSLPAEARSQLG